MPPSTSISSSSKSEDVSLSVNVRLAVSPIDRALSSEVIRIDGAFVSTSMVAFSFVVSNELSARSVKEELLTLAVIVPSKSASGVSSTV